LPCTCDLSDTTVLQKPHAGLFCLHRCSQIAARKVGEATSDGQNLAEGLKSHVQTKLSLHVWPRNIMKAYHMFNAYIYLEASDADTLEDNQHKHGLKPAKRLPEKLQWEMITVARRWT